MLKSATFIDLLFAIGIISTNVFTAARDWWAAGVWMAYTLIVVVLITWLRIFQGRS